MALALLLDFNEQFKEPIESSMLGNLAVETLYHPIRYAKTLVRIGYEPLHPYQSKTLFGKTVWYYPNLFAYLRHVQDVDGFSGLFRGLGPNLTRVVVCRLIAYTKPPTFDDCEFVEERHRDFVKMLLNVGSDIVYEVSNIVVWYPFHLIMVRNMSQFIGRELIYSDAVSATGEVLNNSGISGFFKGMAPLIVGEAVTRLLTGVIMHILTTHVLPKSITCGEYKELLCYIKLGISSLVHIQWTYAFIVVSTVMSVNGSGLAAGYPPVMPIYQDWLECYNHLGKEEQFSRGAGLFFRYVPGQKF